jgi:hypothetical protein
MPGIPSGLKCLYLVPAEGLFALRAHPFGVALKGDRRRCAASSNRLVYVGGSNVVQIGGARRQNNFL